MFFRLRAFRAQAVGLEHIALEDLQRFGHVGNLIRAAGRYLGIQIARGNGFHAVLKLHEAAYHPSAHIIPADDECGAKTDQGEGNQDNPALLDLRFGFADRGGCSHLAARSKTRNLLFEFLGERAIFRHDVGAGLCCNQLFLLELENIAGILAGLDQFIDQF
jgi:hypothetical protein